MKKLTIIILGLLIFSSCKEFLEVKPDKSLAIPSDKLQYLRLLLDNTSVMNEFSPAAGDIASDDSYIPEALWPRLLQSQPTSANAYIWEKDIFNDITRTDWAGPYETVLYANLVLEGLENRSEESHLNEWKELKGSALFYRSYAYLNLLQTFAKAYHTATATTDPGIVLKQRSDINERLPRASVQASYDQIVMDLKAALPLLPEKPAFTTRPGITAGLALLARTYLLMSDFEKAGQYAEQALAKNGVLLNYNTLNAASNFPISKTNPEIIFYSTMIGLSGMSATYGRVNTELYNLYHADDLRKKIFFRLSNGEQIFKGTYSGTTARYNGLATDELYLIAAEAHARRGQLAPALERLNQLLEKRWNPATYSPVTAATADELLPIILTERRKELCYRNRRWADLKRLNMEPRFKKTLVRVVNGTTYTLPPGDSKYAMPIPIKVINFSGIAQN